MKPQATDDSNGDKKRVAFMKSPRRVMVKDGMRMESGIRNEALS
jgi:hypothetical protein